MAKVIYERQGEETSLYATAVTYPDNTGVAKCTTYPQAPPRAVRHEQMGELQGYEQEVIDIPLSRVVRVER